MNPQESILTGQGLYKTVHGRRAQIHKEFVCRSHVVFYQGQILGHIFKDDEFKAFVALPIVGNKELVWDLWEKLSKPWGATGHKVLNIDFVDQVLDLCAKVTL